jgi:AcrR family transcriptional regulator
MADRPERVPAEEVRRRMLNAGRDLALEVGAALTIEHLKLEEVIQRARVPRSSVYRLWPYREEYIDDLLHYLAGEGSWFSERPVLDPETFDLAKQVILDNMSLLDTPQGRRALLCEVVRITCRRNYEVLSESTPWRLHMALISTLGNTRSGEARGRIAAALEDSQRRSRASIVGVLAHLSAGLGLRLRDPSYSLDHIQLAGGVLVQALALRNVQVQAALARPAEPGQADPADNEPDFVNALLNAPIPGPGLNGEPAEWTLVAFAYLGMLDAFMELDPDYGAPHDVAAERDLLRSFGRCRDPASWFRAAQGVLLARAMTRSPSTATPGVGSASK